MRSKPARRVRFARGLQALVDWVFGYDVFVSYAREDGETYARALVDALTAAGLRCFIDTEEMPGGEEVRRTLSRNLERSSMLVLIGTPGARRSTYVREEIATFAALGRPLVPVDLGGFIARDPAWLAELAGDRNRVHEHEEHAARPSEAVLGRLQRSMTFTRQATRRQRFLAGAAGVLALATGLAVFFWVRSAMATAEAEERTRIAVAQRLAAEARASLERTPQRALLLAEAAVMTTRSLEQAVVPEAASALREALAIAGGKGFEAGDESVAALGFDADGQGLFAATESGRVAHWNLSAKDASAVIRVLHAGGGGLEAIEFPSTRGRLVVQLADGTRRDWSVSGGALALEKEWILPLFQPPPDLTESLASAPLPETAYGLDRVTRVTASTGVVRTWDCSGPSPQAASSTVDMAGFDELHLERRGRWLLAISSAGALRVDRLGSGTPVTRLRLPEERGAVRCARFSPSGNRLAVSFEAGTTLVFTLDEVEPSYHELSGSPWTADVLEFSDSETRLAAGARSGRIWVWNVGDDRGAVTILPEVEFRSFDGAFDPGWAILAYSPDERWLFVGDGLRACALFDLHSEEPRRFLLQDHPHADVIDSKLHAPWGFSPDGRWLATASDDNLVHLWPLERADPIAGEIVLRGQDDAASCLAFSPDGTRLATGCFDGRVRMWQLDELRWIASPTLLPGSTDWTPVMSTPWDPYPEQVDLRFVGSSAWLVVSQRSTGRYRVTRVNEDGTMRESVPPEEGPELRYPRAMSANGRWWVSGGDASDILWEFGDEVRRTDLPLVDGHYDWHGDRLAGGDSSGAIHVWELGESMTLERTLSLAEGVAGVGLGESGEVLVGVSVSGSLRIWGREEVRGTLSLPAEEGSLLGDWSVRVLGANRILLDNDLVLEFESDGAARWVPIGENMSKWWWRQGANMLLVEDMENRGALHDLLAPDPNTPVFHIPWELRAINVTSAASGTDALAVGTKLGALAVLVGLESEKPGIDFQVAAHEGSVRAVALSTSGRWLASAGADDALLLWDLSSQDPALESVRLLGHPGSISALAFSEDGRWLAVGSADESVRLYSMDIGFLTTLARETAGRAATAEERQRYLR